MPGPTYSPASSSPFELGQNTGISSRPSQSSASLNRSYRDSELVNNNDVRADKTSRSDQPDRPGLSCIARRPSFYEEDEEQPIPTVTATEAQQQISKGELEEVTWSSLPKKGQLAVLTLARLSEPLSERSLAAYMFYQLRWFDSTLPDSTIASQGGMLTAAFAAAQFVTAVWWGRAADTPWIGRKRVLLIGLSGTAIASIGVGFSTTFTQAMIFRSLAGALNGNIGVMRTMMSEIIQEKKFQSRAFLLLPMCFNIGVVIGPILGGFLADPISAFPGVFGPGSVIGGKDGVGWMTTFPYAFPNLFSGVFIAASALTVILGLDETHEALRNKPDYGRKLGRMLDGLIRRRHGRSGSTYQYTQLDTDETELQSTMPNVGSSSANVEQSSSPTQPSKPERSRSSPFRAIFTPNIILTLLQHHLLAFHVSAFNALIFLLLPAPRSANINAHLPLRFTGGLGLSMEKVGLAMAILGVIGLPLQLLLYPRLNARWGTLIAYRSFLLFSPLAYITLPFLSLLPNKAYLLWPCLALVLASQVLSRTFALTGTVILVNNSATSAGSLGTIHGLAQSVSSAARMLGPTFGGFVLGWGLERNFVGAVWWGLACVAVVNWALLWLIWEGDGRGGRADGKSIAKTRFSR